MEKRIKVLEKVNGVFYLLQLHIPLMMVIFLLDLPIPSCLNVFLNVLFFFPLIFLLQLLFVIETAFLQDYFPEKTRKRMRKLCFFGTLFDLLLGHMLFLGATF